MPTDDLLLWSTTRGVTTLTMNNPRRLNGWTMEMMAALKDGLKKGLGNMFALWPQDTIPQVTKEVSLLKSSTRSSTRPKHTEYKCVC